MAGFGSVATLGITLVAVTVLLTGEAESIPRVVTLSSVATQPPPNAAPSTVRVMSLNLAHGRSDGRHQALQRTTAIRKNLDEIAALLKRTKPDVIGLQEADSPSFWSGDFNHSAYLGRKSSYGFLLPGQHVKGGMLDYGAALLSRLDLSHPASITFPPTPPTFSKGYVVATVRWPGSKLKVDIVSVHLDYSRKSNRKRQVNRMIQKLTERQRPLIVVGDFNCEWKDEGSAVRRLAEELHLRTVDTHHELEATFRSTDARLDWILISSEFEFESYDVLPDVVSDHQPVVAEIGLKQVAPADQHR